MTNNRLSNKYVLVADDDAEGQLAVTRILSQLGARSDTAGNAFELREKLKANRYELVLMDIEMASMNGFETTLYIRNELSKDIPIFGMVDRLLESEQDKFQKFGIDGILIKPINSESLVNEFERLLPGGFAGSTKRHILTNQHVAVDINMLYETAGDDESYIALMVQVFLQNMPRTLKNIDESLLNKDWDGLYKAAHFAKSSLSVIRVSGMFEAVLAVEERAKKRIDLDTLPMLVQQIKQYFVLAEEVLVKKYSHGL
jgi:CheY-like chemotaxis protein